MRTTVPSKRTVSARAYQLRAQVRQAIEARYPRLFPAMSDRTSIVLGRDHDGLPVLLPERARREHAHVIGTTGGGKTKFLEHCIRQDIANGHGVCLIDPHGDHPDSCYRSVLSWLDQEEYTRTRTIHLIDPNVPSHVTGFDPLTPPDADYDPAVIAEAVLEAFERIWGEEDSNTKPTLQRVLTTLVSALCELGLTLAEMRLLVDPRDSHGVRAWAIEHVQDEEVREELEWLHAIALEPRGRQDFRVEVTGPRNRLSKLTRLKALRSMVGQQERIIDFREALDDGHIILVNLSGGPRVSDKGSELLGRLLTRTLFFHAERRRHPERPFFFYLDECQLYLSGDVSRLLSEARKWGLVCVLSHQFLGQLRTADEELLEAVKNTTNVKVVLRVKDTTEATELADMVCMYNLETPVQALIKPTVVGHRIRQMRGESASEQESVSQTRTRTIGHSTTIGHSETQGTSVTESKSIAVSSSESSGWADGETTTSGLSESKGTSRQSAAAHGKSLGWNDSMTPGTDVFGRRTVLGVSEGANFSSQHSEAVGSNSSRGSQSAQSTSSTRSESTSTGTSTTTGHSVTESESSTQSFSETESTADSHGTGVTRGTGRTNSTQEGLEPIYQNLPGGVHSLENVRYMSAQAIRKLTAGQALINFVSSDGMQSASLKVANVESYALPARAFDALRTRVFDSSPSACPRQDAERVLAERERALLLAAQPAEALEPSNFRTTAPPAVTQSDRSPPVATGQGRARGSKKGKRPVR